MPTSFDVTPQLLTTIAGVLLSLIFSYVPKVKDWWQTVDSQNKSLLMLGLLLVTTLAVFGLSCGDIVKSVTCDKPGAIQLFWAFISALIANQATYMITPQPK